MLRSSDFKILVLYQGRSQDLTGGGGAKNMFHIWKPCAMLGGSVACPQIICFVWIQFGAFWCIFGSDLVFKTLKKYNFFI